MPYPTCTLLAVLLLSQTAHSITPVVLFTSQSQNTSFYSWVDYITLCFAPLIGHVIGGVASPTLISQNSKEPAWSALLPHFNPISIIWRWYAIADRRLRACSWDATDMVVCNAVFWNAEKTCWDGSEETMVRAREWITEVPRLSHVPLVSTSSLTTLILTVQGIQASFLVFGSLNAERSIRIPQGLPNIFIPIGFLGLARLPAALWLSDDHVYVDVPQTRSCNGHDVARSHGATVEEAGDPLLELDPRTSKRAVATTTTTTLTSRSATLSIFSEPTTSNEPRLQPINSRVAVLYRIWWFVSITCLLGGSAVSTWHFVWRLSPSFPYVSLSRLLFDIMYFVFTTATVLITNIYILLGRTRSTVIPCIHATWYKVFTVALIAMAVVTTVLAGLETRQAQNGDFTTLPEFQCNNTAHLCVPVSRGYGDYNT